VNKGIVFDDIMYIFHKNMLDKGAFSPIEGRDKEEEHFHTNMWKSRNIDLNVVGLNIKLTTKKHPNSIYSGNIV
jgi:hypothetical protein